MIEILCTVRDCHEPLARGAARWTCACGHSFDVAKSGYCNLLQPNERRSRKPGDSAEAVRARRRLLDRGIGGAFTRSLVELMADLDAPGPFLDAGCGEGSHLSPLCDALGAEGIGIDISTPAIDLAARRDRHRTWVVANVDRHVPVADRSIGTVLSVTARINRAEFARVLRPGGLMVVVVPGADDLAELRERVLGARQSLQRVPDKDLLGEHFAPVRQFEVRESIEVDEESIGDLLVSTYRGQRRSQVAAAASIGPLNVTQSRVVSVYRAIDVP